MTNSKMTNSKIIPQQNNFRPDMVTILGEIFRRKEIELMNVKNRLAQQTVGVNLNVDSNSERLKSRLVSLNRAFIKKTAALTNLTKIAGTEVGKISKLQPKYERKAVERENAYQDKLNELMTYQTGSDSEQERLDQLKVNSAIAEAKNHKAQAKLHQRKKTIRGIRKAQEKVLDERQEKVTEFQILVIDSKARLLDVTMKKKSLAAKQGGKKRTYCQSDDSSQ